MRLDELPRSDRIEDRRGFTAGHAGIGVGTVVVLTLIGWALGIDPRVLIGGAEQLSGGSETQQQQVNARPSGGIGAPSDENGPICLSYPRQHRSRVGGGLRSG